MLPAKQVSGGRLPLALLLLLVGLLRAISASQSAEPPPQAASSTAPPTRGAQTSAKRQEGQTTNDEVGQLSCDYEKGTWGECQADGLQRRTLKLSRTSSKATAAHCEPTKTIKRECKPVGCKYARGDWSNNCEDGQRVRVDSLVGKLGDATNCKLERRVTKDCKRACHYIKSAWGECENGFKTRNLTLDETGPLLDKRGRGKRASFVALSAPQTAQFCARQKLVRRECTSSAAPAPRPGARARPAGLTAPRPLALTAAQRRRLKSAQVRRAAAAAQITLPAAAATSTSLS